MKESEEPEDGRGERERKLRSKAAGSTRDYKIEKVSSTEYLFNKMTTLPVHMKTFQVLTALRKCRPWWDTFSSFLIDLRLGVHILNEACGCSSLSQRWLMTLMSKVKVCPGALKGNSVYSSLPQSAIKHLISLPAVANTANIRCINVCTTWPTSFYDKTFSDIAVGNTSKSQFYSRDSRISYMLKSLLWLVQCFLIMRITERLA